MVHIARDDFVVDLTDKKFLWHIIEFFYSPLSTVAIPMRYVQDKAGTKPLRDGPFM